ncbi:heavy metal translocating P-type ATPase [Mycoplasmatota bacterium zrk1]
MKYQVIMDGLMCTGCAGKIEKEINKLNYIKEANYNLANQIMNIETNGSIDTEIMLEVMANIVDSIEDGVNVYYKGTNSKNRKRDFSYLFILVGIIVFSLGYFLNEHIFFYIGYSLVASKIVKKSILSIKNRYILDENTLMLIATLAALYIKEYWEAVAVLIFYSIGEYFQNRAVKKSRSEIEGLISLKVDQVTVLKGIKQITKTPDELKIGDILLIKVGEQIPVDSVIVKGDTMFNTSAMTGESMPLIAEEGTKILSGFINISKVIEVKVIKTFKDSALSKIVDLIENSTNTKSNTEMFITKFAKFYTPLVVIVAFLLVLVPSIISLSNFNSYLYRAAVFLVISCPCALVLSIPLSYFAGIGKSASQNVLFKGSNYLELLTKVKDVFLDKTGTITYGNFKVQTYTSDRILQLAASIERYSKHPIAEAIQEKNRLDLLEIKEIKEIAGHGLVGLYHGKTLLVGNDKLMNQYSVNGYNEGDGTTVHIAYDNIYLGKIVIVDEIKESSINAIGELNKNGINVHMLTGDSSEVAEKVSNTLEIDYHASLLPEDKVNIIKEHKSAGEKVFIGDGINDAPALLNADIGISMGKKGSDLAIEVADVIIMDDSLTSFVKAISISKVTRKIVYQNIIFALGIKLLFLVLGGFGITTMWMAIFSDVGVSLLAVMNALRILYRKYEELL